MTATNAAADATTARLEAAADRTEIVDLVARIAQLADSGTVEEYIGCFTADAVWSLTAAQGLPMEAQTVHGREAILAGVIERRAAGIQGPGTHSIHAVQRTTVTVDGDAAHADSIFLYYTHTDQTPTLVALGQYDDAFVRTEGRWLLAKRTIRRD